MCGLGAQEGSKNNNEQNTPPKKKRRVTKDILVKFVFGSVTQQRMYDWSDEQGKRFNKEQGSYETVTNLVWASPDGDGYTPETKYIIFIDCSSDVGHAYDATTQQDISINPRIFYAIERIKTFLFRCSKKYNMDGTLHSIILAFHPCEKHMFAMSNLFGHSLPEQEVYSSYISFINSKPEYKYSLRWLEEEFGWNFDVQYCGIFEAYDVMYIDKDEEEKKEHLRELINELETVNKRYGLSDDKDEKGRYLVPDRSGFLDWGNVHQKGYKVGDPVDWGDPKYGTDYVDLNGHQWKDDPNYTENGQPWGYHYNYVQPTINYRGKDCTIKDLRNMITGDYSSWDLRSQANKLQKAYDAKQEKRQKNLDAIDKKIKEAERQLDDDTSPEYQEWKEIENLDKAYAENYRDECWYAPYQHHSQDRVDYHGAYRTKGELQKLKQNIEDKMKEERQQFEELMNAADEKDRIAQQMSDAGWSGFIALFSLIFPPFALVDIGVEIYRWVRDGDNLENGLKKHGLSMGFDVVGLIPYVGGCIKIVREARAIKTLARANALVSEVGEAAVKMEGAATKMTNAAKKSLDASKALAKARQASSTLNSTIKDSKVAISQAKGIISANNKAIRKKVAQGQKYAKPRRDKIAENVQKIERYEGYLKQVSKKNRPTIKARIKQLNSQNKALQAEINAKNGVLADEIGALQQTNRSLRQGINAASREQGANVALLQQIKDFSTKANGALKDARADIKSAKVDFGKAEGTYNKAEGVYNNAVQTLESFQHEINTISGAESTLTGLANSGVGGKDILKQIAFGSKDLPSMGNLVPKVLKPSEWKKLLTRKECLTQLADMGSNTYAWYSVVDNGYNFINVGFAGSVYFENPQKMARFVESQESQLSPEILENMDIDDIDMDNLEDFVMQDSDDLDLTIDYDVKRLMNERDISEDEAIVQLIEDNKIDDENLDLIRVDDSGKVSETDNMWKILNGKNSGDITEEEPMTDEEIIDFQNDALVDKAIEQSTQEDLQAQIDKKHKQGAKDSKGLREANDRYDKAFGKIEDDKIEAQNHIDMINYSLGTDEDGNQIVTDPEERARLEAEKAEWQNDLDALNRGKAWRYPTGRYAQDIQEESDAEGHLESTERAWNKKYSTSDLEKQKEQSEENERQADRRIKKANEALEAGNNSRAASAQAEQATNDEDRQDAEHEKRKNDNIRKNRENDIRSMQ